MKGGSIMLDRLIRLSKEMISKMKSVSSIEYTQKAHQVEFTGKLYEDGRMKDMIVTIQAKHYIPRDVYGEAGHFYTRERKRKVRTKDRKWTYITEEVTMYELSEADKKFIYVSYVHHHLNQRQISVLSGIPQPYVYRYIKHMKLKPKYPEIKRSDRVKNVIKEIFGDESEDIEIITDRVMATAELPDEKEEPEEELPELPEDIDFQKPFHVDPYPTRSEWKVRREEYGLKNGEDWRNKPYDENPGAKIYGDGSTARRKKVAKQKRREKIRIKNIRKYNLHQNNRYNMTEENPDGDQNLIKFDENKKKK